MLYRIRKRAQADSGFAMIEAVLAIGLVGVVSVGLLGVSVALSSQSRASRDVIFTRQIAEQVTERSIAHGCGLQSGVEDASIIALVVTRCNEALDISSGMLLGDLATTIERKTVNYAVALRHRWLPGSSADNDPVVSCADLSGYTPHAVQREVIVSRLPASSNDNTYSFSQVEAVPVDSAAFSGGGALLVTDIPSGTSVEMIIPTDPTYRLRRFASVMSGDVDGCAWFPFLPPGNYEIARTGIVASCPRAVTGSATTSISFDLLPTSPEDPCGS
jgi:type II secretory pathway pseudopilin PulG